MKTYEKPKLVALSIVANNMLCDSCAVDIIGNNADEGYLAATELITSLGMTITFGDGETNCISSDTQVAVSGYCKFTSTNMVINS